MEEPIVSGAHRQILLDQKIDMSHPGTVLSDFQVLLEAVGSEGFEASGKHMLLPMSLIDELDQRLSRPLRLGMKRPQLRSHPYLQGLYLLLCATGLSRVDGSESKARVVLDPKVLSCWNSLNPTEQYFTLLEAWLVNGKPEMIGDRENMFKAFLVECLQFWKSIPKQGIAWTGSKAQFPYLPGVGRDIFLIALLDLFGLIKVEIPSKAPQPWLPAAVKHTPFGDEMMSLLFDEFAPPFMRFDPANPDRLLADNSPDSLTDELDDEHEHEADDASFGYLQPLFQPYFPEWRENLSVPADDAREGELVFRVSWGKSVWRQIAIRADATLEDLASWILTSVNFEEDHLYEFVLRNRFGAVERLQHPDCDEGPWVSQYQVGQLPLDVGQSMQFHFDFGDDWRFDVKLEDVLPVSKKSKTARILKKHGKAPEQYPGCDDY
jgi:hypothetical protein